MFNLLWWLTQGMVGLNYWMAFTDDPTTAPLAESSYVYAFVAFLTLLLRFAHSMRLLQRVTVPWCLLPNEIVVHAVAPSGTGLSTLFASCLSTSP